MNDRQIIDRAREVFDTELEGLRLTKESLGDGFVQTVRLLFDTLAAGGKIVVSGVGKNLHIAEKFSASLASTGSTSVVMNPIQAMHGDLGIVTENDVLVALSFSGESDEVIKLIPAVRRLGLKVVGVVGNEQSTLAKLSDVVLPVKIGKEACPFGMAPTTSTTATLALADAVAMVLIDLHDFRKENFARLHPAGAIGRALVLRARDIMRSGEHVARVKDCERPFRTGPRKHFHVGPCGGHRLVGRSPVKGAVNDAACADNGTASHQQGRQKQHSHLLRPFVSSFGTAIPPVKLFSHSETQFTDGIVQDSLPPVNRKIDTGKSTAAEECQPKPRRLETACAAARPSRSSHLKGLTALMPR